MRDHQLDPLSLVVTAHGVRITGLPDWQRWTFLVELSEGTDPGATAVQVQAPEGELVRPNQWRALPIGRVIRLAETTRHHPILAGTAERLGIDVENLGRRPYRGGVEFLRQLAAMYRAALDQGLPPKKSLAEFYGVSAKTMAGWLTEARKTTDPATGKNVLRSWEEERNDYSFEHQKAVHVAAHPPIKRISRTKKTGRKTT